MKTSESKLRWNKRYYPCDDEQVIEYQSHAIYIGIAQFFYAICEMSDKTYKLKHIISINDVEEHESLIAEGFGTLDVAMHRAESEFEQFVLDAYFNLNDN